jgi:hypothetical protein
MKQMTLTYRLWLPTALTAVVLVAATALSGWRTSVQAHAQQEALSDHRDKLEI